jgi:hypothetical protein
MSMGSMFADFLCANFDLDMLGKGAEMLRQHRWGHLPVESVGRSTVDHIQTSMQHYEKLDPHVGLNAERVPHLSADAAEVVRQTLGERRRSNLYHQSMVDIAHDSVARNLTGPEREQRKGELRDVTAKLARERTAIQGWLDAVDKHHPANLTSKAREHSLNVLNWAKTKAYRYPVTAGVLMCAVVIGIPAYMLISLMRDESRRERQPQ